MFDTELQRRSALCYWTKVIVPDGTIDLRDSISILGGYPFDLQSINLPTHRFILFIAHVIEEIIEITLSYRK